MNNVNKSRWSCLRWIARPAPCLLIWCVLSMGWLGCSTTYPRSVLPPPVEPPESLLDHAEEPLPALTEQATEVDLVKRIHELTARLSNRIIEHRGLSEFVVDEYQRYKKLYDNHDKE